jgi:hypothetical protein
MCVLHFGAVLQVAHFRPKQRTWEPAACRQQGAACFLLCAVQEVVLAGKRKEVAEKVATAAYGALMRFL